MVGDPPPIPLSLVTPLAVVVGNRFVCEPGPDTEADPDAIDADGVEDIVGCAGYAVALMRHGLLEV